MIILNSKKLVLAVHGGAGRWNLDNDTREAVYRSLRDALNAGFNVLKSGGKALDAVVEAVKVLEDSEIFNAGIGSALNALGYVEMDAGIMDGRSLRAIGIGATRYPKNPIVLARYAMEYTDHVIIVGEGADRLAKILRLEPRNNYIPSKIVAKYRELVKNPRSIGYWKKLPEILPKFLVGDTVGAVAMDDEGNVAAAASTGGVWLKLPGRIGDTPIVGAGFYADNRGGAAVATGLGEVIIMYGLTRKAVEKMISGLDANTACVTTIRELTSIYGDNNAGILCLDLRGEIVAVHNTPAMPYGYIEDLELKISFSGVKI
ncbi:peptidase T2 asparaginase 2 [Ignisphaera aggregans DSM 17230]|uniref:Plant-type L-asparaginase n=1 Tax=Ignisphaera aggregans (strain DSM 17230 / JCM 13409 / AQ1.S1) TaxID=583356 RepID=E0SQD6_IGNAA|nr:peptidase T2 asparaginase 2 [Ignisphaera aggregans DSM 17230]